jgi:hypothetical protein
MTYRRFAVIALMVSAVFAISAGVRAQAQATAKPASVDTTQGPAVTLKVTVVLSKFLGEKKTASLPFVLMVLPGESETSVQMSSQLPIPQTAIGDGKTSMSYSYQNFGTNISASAKAGEGGQFSVTLSISDSQMMGDAGAASAPMIGPAVPEALRGLVRMQNFSSRTKLLLRDGQTVQYPAATDKFTGEVVRVEVTLNVIK